jgi:hypothetical protein
MIKSGNEYLVSAQDIYNTAINTCQMMGIAGWNETQLKEILNSFSNALDEISVFNHIPWTSESSWKIYSTKLREEETLNEILAKIKDELAKIPKD